MDIFSNNNAASVELREQLVQEDANIWESVERGLRQSAANDTVDLGSFTEFADTEVAV